MGRSGRAEIFCLHQLAQLHAIVSKHTKMIILWRWKHNHLLLEQVRL
ncbi:hypothetical protein [Alkalihalobacillus pseudalcaliphilus]|nr:hypothetical protein [Alkalihalobacillus pseudalcaliphilus]